LYSFCWSYLAFYTSISSFCSLHFIFWPQISCDTKDKMLHILALLKFELIQKKVLIFVNSIDMAFRLRLFLEKVNHTNALSHYSLPWKRDWSSRSVKRHFNLLNTWKKKLANISWIDWFLEFLFDITWTLCAAIIVLVTYFGANHFLCSFCIWCYKVEHTIMSQLTLLLCH
jgi:hypothetical protein